METGSLKDVVYTVDIILLTYSGVPLIVRKNDPYKDYFAIPGGKVDLLEDAVAALGDFYNENFLEDSESFERVLKYAATREAKEEIVGSVKVNGKIIEPEIKIVEKVGVYDKPGRDPRGNYITHVYLARLMRGNIRAASDARKYEYFTEMPRVDIAFDHEEILKDSKVFERCYPNGRLVLHYLTE